MVYALVAASVAKALRCNKWYHVLALRSFCTESSRSFYFSSGEERAEKNCELNVQNASCASVLILALMA